MCRPTASSCRTASSSRRSARAASRMRAWHRCSPAMRCSTDWIASLPNRPADDRRPRRPRRALALRIGELEHQAVEGRRRDQLAGEPAVGPALGGDALEHRVLAFRGGFEIGESRGLDVAVAGGAGTEPAALADDAVDVVDDRATHEAPAIGHFDRDGLAVGLDVSDSSHCRGPGDPEMLTAARNLPDPTRRQAVPSFVLYGETGTHRPDLLHVETLAARSHRYGWVIAPHTHRGLHQVLWIEAGRARLRLDEARLGIDGPAIVVVPAGVVHGFGFSPDIEGMVVTIGARRLVSECDEDPGGHLATLFDAPRMLRPQGEGARRIAS